ncbi:MAG: LolA family protein [Planctomycetota bacterium]|jgi:hypothetical protein
MRKNVPYLSNLVLLLVLFGGIRCQDREPSRPSHLSTVELLDLYESMYSKIRNAHVSYDYVLEKAEGDSTRLDGYVRYEKVDRIEEGEKYDIRYSMASEHYAFDGSTTMEYYPRTRTGEIIGGKRGRAVETMNNLWHYMLINRSNPRNPELREKYPDGRPYIRGAVSIKALVRPQLEEVNGHWCHVADSLVQLEPYTTTWFAVDKEALPIKFEMYKDGKCIRRVLVTKVASLDTTLEQATDEFYDKDGYRLYKFRLNSFKPNIEITPETFKLSFPKGTKVVDHVKGTWYTVGASAENEGSYGILQGD